MVIDSLNQASRYMRLGRGIEQALAFFCAFRDDGKELPARTELDGEHIFINGANYTTQQKPLGELEAHRRYIDVMYVVEGEERVFYKPFEQVSKITMPYSAEKECALGVIDPDAAQMRFSAGQFLIFFPEDGHLAAQLWDEPTKVRKFIAKVAVDTL